MYKGRCNTKDVYIITYKRFIIRINFSASAPVNAQLHQAHKKHESPLIIKMHREEGGEQMDKKKKKKPEPTPEE